MKNILITGGAGYIGSHCVLNLKNAGYNCIVLDNLSEGHKEAVLVDNFHKANLSNLDEIKEVFNNNKIDAVIHFAAYAYVGESVTNPQKYYYNNVVNTLNLLNVMLEFNVKNIVFSSTCATYGDPQYIPIDEKHPQHPINPYGQTKLMMEKILQDYDKAYGMKSIILRYFNACGADNNSNIGESHNIETHLIPLVLQAAKDKQKSIKIFGNDYDTTDGSCIRDYIHVNDLAEAHKLALELLLNTKTSDIFNLGTGNGHSVKEIISICEKVTGVNIKKEITPRREGDPPALVASNKKATTILNWKPEHSIENIISSAWSWEQNKTY